MSTVEDVLPWISSLDIGPLSRVSLTGALAGRAAARPTTRAVEVRSRVGTCSLRQIVDGAVAAAEGEAIRRALTATVGNKSQAARLLRTNYTTLHAKMKRYGISAREFRD
ncbi:MAG TPA: helix-turn-helix domain-containing protein [Candidatus Dormibacteraeota bacterium]|jgi:two-component system nitrogen regulation response regulator GlnG|nr:helix-turn-helix domain-containing protein [Candidatus Dormibacteraeota bacterium]